MHATKSHVYLSDSVPFKDTQIQSPPRELKRRISQGHAVHLPGESNCAADTLSRWHENASTRTNFLELAVQTNLTEAEVPAALFALDNPH